MEQKLMLQQTIEWCSKSELLGRAKAQIVGVPVILDIGCGIRPQSLVKADVHICVEPSAEYVDLIKQNTSGGSLLIVPLPALEALSALPDRSIDSVFLIDVIEHMPKEAGVQVLNQCKRVSRCQVIVFTPLGFMPQQINAGQPDGWGMQGGEWQQHKSGWYPEDFPDWKLIVCKDFHDHDHQGQPVSPAYGALYAIHSKSPNHNLFNADYASLVLGPDVALPEGFPLLRSFIGEVVRHEIAKCETAVAVEVCGRVAEILSQTGNAAGAASAMAQVSSIRHDVEQRISGEFGQRIRHLADYMGLVIPHSRDITQDLKAIESRRQAERDLDALRADMDEKEEALRMHAAQLEAKQKILSDHETGLRTREGWVESQRAVLIKHEQELQALKERIDSRSIFLRIRKLISSFFNPRT
jgi:hypothetical protein